GGVGGETQHQVEQVGHGDTPGGLPDGTQVSTSTRKPVKLLNRASAFVPRGWRPLALLGTLLANAVQRARVLLVVAVGGGKVGVDLLRRSQPLTAGLLL